MPTEASPEEIKASEVRYQEAISIEKVPVGATVEYAHYMKSDEFDRDLEFWMDLELEINGFKKRTSRGYALNDCSVQHIVQTNKTVFDDLGIK